MYRESDKDLEGQVLRCDITYYDLLRRPALETGAYSHLLKQPFSDLVKIGFGNPQASIRRRGLPDLVITKPRLVSARNRR
jgi:hypothetical protein